MLKAQLIRCTPSLLVKNPVKSTPGGVRLVPVLFRVKIAATVPLFVLSYYCIPSVQVQKQEPRAEPNNQYSRLNHIFKKYHCQ
jgi:hypothetical protein